MPRRSWVMLAGVVVVLCLGAGAAFRAHSSSGPKIASFDLHGQWIASEGGHLGVTQFRKTFILSGAVRAAWLAVAAADGFEVTVNGASVGSALPGVTSLPYQASLTERGQAIASPQPAIGFNFPHEYQWDGQRGYLLPTFFDLAPYLGRGKNSLCFEVESRGSPALRAEGEVLLWSGERVRLDTDTSFKAADRPPEDGRTWTEADYSDLAWPAAVVGSAPPGTLRRILDPGVFEQPFAGQWLRASLPFDEAIWFETRWPLDRGADEAWIRVLSDRDYQLFVNGSPVRVAEPQPQDSDAGEWTLAPRLLRDRLVAPQAMAVGEADGLFGDLPFEVHPPAQGPEVRERPARSAPPPELLPPRALDRPPRAPKLNGYGIARLLHGGDNTIAIRVVAPDPETSPATLPPRVAIDGHAVLSNGTESVFGESGQWLARTQGGDGSLSQPSPAFASGPAASADAALPRLQYRGDIEPPGFVGRVAASVLSVLVAMGLLAQVPGALQALAARFSRRPSSEAAATPEEAAQARRATQLWMLMVAGSILLAVFVLDVSWRERDDLLLLLPPSVWRAVLATVFTSSVGVAVAREWRPRRRARPWVALLPDGRLWPYLVGLVLLAAAFLRAHAVAFQPWEDDEVASMQAAMAIARTGVPKYSTDVFYTRSPLYHYTLGASVRLFGANVWSLRMPSVVFSVATTLLLYLVGARLLKSRWTGLVAAGLYAIHPYALFVGHLARFYQQQQFFSLLTAYFFCQGFVTHRGSPQKARFLALASFLAACLSQELCVVMAVPLVAAGLLYARRWERRSVATLVIAAACSAALVVLDLGIALLSGTRAERPSPNVEATLDLHFANPLNFFTIFVSYSRLHLALSVVLLLGLPLLLSSRNRSTLALITILAGGVVATNLLVSFEALRYQYWLVAIWLVLGVDAARRLVQAAANAAGDDPIARDYLAPALGGIAVTAVVLSWSPWSILRSYGVKIDTDTTASLAFVRGELRGGDKVAAAEPQPPAALLEIGQSDYDLAVPLLEDYVYRKDGKLIDRNASAEVASTLEQLQDAVARNDRLWVIVNRTKFRSRGQHVLWQLPTARIEAFLRENFALEHQSFESAVFLWDVRLGRFRSFRQHGTPYL